MIKIKKWIACFFALAILVYCGFVLGISNNISIASAENIESIEIENVENAYKANSDDIDPYAVVSLTITLNGGNGNVWATVYNNFTLFFPTVVVVVELYSSSTFYESYKDMELVSMNSIGDLDINKSIAAIASTGGVQKYWNGRMRYKINGGDWKEKSTGTVSYDGEGNFLGNS